MMEIYLVTSVAPVPTQDVQVKISDRFGNAVTKNVSVVVQ